MNEPKRLLRNLKGRVNKVVRLRKKNAERILLEFLEMVGYLPKDARPDPSTRSAIYLTRLNLVEHYENAKFMNTKVEDFVDNSSIDTEYFIPPTIDEIRSEYVAPQDQPLSRAKIQINDMLEDRGHTNPVKKKSYINKVLGKSTIDTLDDANKVADALEGKA